MIIIPVLALSALFKLANPDVTLHVPRAASYVSVAHTGAEHSGVGLEYLSRPKCSQLSHLSLPGQSPLGVEGSVQFGSPVDLDLLFAPLPTPARKSRPTTRAVTHESGTLTDHKSNSICGTICRLLAFKGPSTGLFSSSSSSLSSFPSTSSSSLSSPDSHFHGSLNTSANFNSTSLPVYGPEWEWSPRDLIVFVPQPSCPVPVLLPDMSTLPTLNRCTPGSQDYYADLIRVAMVKQTSVVSRLDWCGRDSEELEAGLKRAATMCQKLGCRRFMRLVIESLRQRELARLLLVDGYEQARQPIALCYLALVVCYGLFMYALSIGLYSNEKDHRISGAQQSSTSEPTSSPVDISSQVFPRGPVHTNALTEMNVTHSTTVYSICIVALAVVYALLICIICDVEPRKKKVYTSGGYQTVACECARSSVPRNSEAGSVTRPSPPPFDSRPHTLITVKFHKPQPLCSTLPPKSLVDPVSPTVPEPAPETLEVVADSPVIPSTSLDEEEVGIQEKSEIAPLEHNDRVQDGLSPSEEVPENDGDEPLEHPLPLRPATVSSSSPISEPSDLAPGTVVMDLSVVPIHQEVEIQATPKEEVATVEPVHDSPVDLDQQVLEEEEEEGDGVMEVQGEAVPLEVECDEENGDETGLPSPPCLDPDSATDSSLPCLSEWFDQESGAVAGGSSAKAFDWADSKPEKNVEVAQLEREEQEQRNQAQKGKGKEPEEKKLEGERKERGCDEKRWEEKMKEIKLKMEEEQAEARKMAELTARRGDGKANESTVIQANAASASEESEERWEMVSRRKNRRGPIPNPSGSGGSGSSGSRASRRA